MSALSFTIPGRVGGKQRAGRQHLPGGAVRSFNPRKTTNQEAMVRQIAALAMRAQRCPIMLGAVSLSVTVYKIPPRSWSQRKQRETKWITGKPDCDNIIKLIADALNGIAWRDDAQIASLKMLRQYASDGEAVHVLIQGLD